MTFHFEAGYNTSKRKGFCNTIQYLSFILCRIILVIVHTYTVRQWFKILLVANLEDRFVLKAIQFWRQWPTTILSSIEKTLSRHYHVRSHSHNRRVIIIETPSMDIGDLGYDNIHIHMTIHTDSLKK